MDNEDEVMLRLLPAILAVGGSISIDPFPDEGYPAAKINAAEFGMRMMEDVGAAGRLNLWDAVREKVGASPNHLYVEVVHDGDFKVHGVLHFFDSEGGEIKMKWFNRWLELERWVQSGMDKPRA